MKNQTKTIIVCIILVALGWLVIHKKAISPTTLEPAKEETIAPASTPAPVRDSTPRAPASKPISSTQVSQPPEGQKVPAKATSSPAPAADFLLTAGDTGKTFTIVKGKTFTLSIPERTDGYDSVSLSYQAAYLDMIDHGLKANGTRSWTFKAVASGTSKLSVTATAQKGGTPEQIFANTVVVTE